jgi:hypothetical protein
MADEVTPWCLSTPDLVCIDNSPVASLVTQPLQPLGRTTNSRAYDLLRDALDDLGATAQNFAWVCINDAGVRGNYLRKIAQISADVLAEVNAGKATAEAGAEFANGLRNTIMDESRRQLSSIGEAASEAYKITGKTLEQLVEENVAKMFPGRQFAELLAVERREIFLEIIRSSGRGSLRFAAFIPKLRLAGRGCVLFTVAIVTYDLWTADNKVEAGLNDALVFGGGAAGGALAGAATGLVCGPAAPFCSTALFIVGGIMGAMAGQAISHHYAAEIHEFSSWLQEM